MDFIVSINDGQILQRERHFCARCQNTTFQVVLKGPKGYDDEIEYRTDTLVCLGCGFNTLKEYKEVFNESSGEIEEEIRKFIPNLSRDNLLPKRDLLKELPQRVKLLYEDLLKNYNEKALHLCPKDIELLIVSIGIDRDLLPDTHSEERIMNVDEVFHHLCIRNNVKADFVDIVKEFHFWKTNDIRSVIEEPYQDQVLLFIRLIEQIIFGEYQLTKIYERVKTALIDKPRR